MGEYKRVTEKVSEGLTMGQIEKVWQQVDLEKKNGSGSLSLQVFWFAGIEVWVIEEDGVTTMMFPNEE